MNCFVHGFDSVLPFCLTSLDDVCEARSVCREDGVSQLSLLFFFPRRGGEIAETTQNPAQSNKGHKSLPRTISNPCLNGFLLSTSKLEIPWTTAVVLLALRRAGYVSGLR